MGPTAGGPSSKQHSRLCGLPCALYSLVPCLATVTTTGIGFKRFPAVWIGAFSAFAVQSHWKIKHMWCGLNLGIVISRYFEGVYMAALLGLVEYVDHWDTAYGIAMSCRLNESISNIRSCPWRHNGLLWQHFYGSPPLCDEGIFKRLHQNKAITKGNYSNVFLWMKQEPNTTRCD